MGTVAFRSYAGLLGVKLPGTAIRTGDVDIAQYSGVSVALNETIHAALIDILLSVDRGFRPLPSLTSPNSVTAYTRPGGYRVDVLTTNRGAERDEPVNLPSLQSDAVALRYLDYLMRDTIEAAVLTHLGARANAPAPERYAVHKLIVLTLRRDAGESGQRRREVLNLDRRAHRKAPHPGASGRGFGSYKAGNSMAKTLKIGGGAIRQ